jgi:hypothetical protein
MPFVAKTHQGGWGWAADVGAACSSQQVQLSSPLQLMLHSTQPSNVLMARAYAMIWVAAAVVPLPAPSMS